MEALIPFEGFLHDLAKLSERYMSLIGLTYHVPVSQIELHFGLIISIAPGMYHPSRSAAGSRAPSKVSTSK